MIESSLPLLPLFRFDDAIVITALKKCGLSNGTIFSLMWGLGLLDGSFFPKTLAQIINDILEEDLAIKEIMDSVEKKLRRIVFDLNYMIMYEAKVDRLVELMIKTNQEQSVRYGRRSYEK